MTVVASVESSLALLEETLLLQANLPERIADYDMNDEAELGLLKAFPVLHESLKSLAVVAKRWRENDTAAMQSQTVHRLLARTAIVAGTAAIVMAVIQLAMKQTVPRLIVIPFVLEAIAVFSALVAVGIGLFAKIDRRWIGKRHLAERQRMLKFHALEQLPCLTKVAWEQWVEQKLAELKGADEFHAVEAWSQEDEVEPAVAGEANGQLGIGERRALAVYYRIKRLQFQAQYFDRRRKLIQNQTAGWRRLTLPLFLSSVICVLAHFALEQQARHVATLERAHIFASLAIWSVALAAVIPVISAGFRAWFAAFELPRSASLYGAKCRALVRLAAHIAKDSGDIAVTQHHMTQTEHFLEQEHREWLRLLCDTEWFI